MRILTSLLRVFISLALLSLLYFTIHIYRPEITSAMPDFRSFLDKARAKAEDFAQQHNIPTQFPGQTPQQQQTQSHQTQYQPAPNNTYAPPIPPNKPTPTPQPYWQPTFSPTVPVTTHFKHQLGAHGWGNNELQNYIASPLNSFHTPDGKLVVRAIARDDGGDRYTSARLTSHQTLGRQRGSLTAVASPPCADGIWPALWLLPAEPFQWPNEAEFDILETWNADSINHSCLHWGQFNGEDWDKHRAIETNVSDMHTGRPIRYELVWEQDEQAGRNSGGGRAVWYIDGRVVMKAPIPVGARRMSDWQVIINVAMGGNVCQGKVPGNGQYDMVVHELKLCDEPAAGWGRFEADWHGAPEGHH